MRIIANKASRQTHRRGGYVMVLFAMLLFGIMAMAALVIDIGFARLAQRQLQSAADSAALEGLRGQGVIDYEDRQTNAEQLIARHFDDDLDADNGDDGIADQGGAFGAGPIVNFSDGAGDSSIYASQLMTVDPNNPVYKPIMQRGGETPGEFRVSIQRGGALDDDAALFAQGPSVPYLFTRGSLIRRELIDSGISVGSEAIAEVRPAVHVGPMVGSVLGIVSVAYSSADWGAMPTNPVRITSPISSGLSIGEAIAVGGSTVPPESGYCGVYDPATNRVIGFGILGQTTPLEGVVAPQNASARLSDVWVVLSQLTTADRDSVMSQNRTLGYSLKSPLLVRRVP